MPKRPPRNPVVETRFWESVTKEHETTRAEIRYFGVVKRIPVAAFPRKHSHLKALALEWDESPQSLEGDLPASLPVSMQGWEPLPQSDCRALRGLRPGHRRLAYLLANPLSAQMN